MVIGENFPSIFSRSVHPEQEDRTGSHITKYFVLH